MATAIPTPAEVEAVRDIVKAQAVIQSSEGVSFVVAPPGYSVKDITADFEKTRAHPDRKRGTAVLHSVDSLIQYSKDMGMQAAGYMYADVDARTITAVFDDFKATSAEWRQHRAQFKAELTPEAQLWMKNDRESMGQVEFAEFIEDNIKDLAEGTMLLEMATTISATSGINFSSARRLQDGQTQLAYNEQIDAVAGATGNLMIPKVFTLGLRIFKGDSAGYAVTARLKYRLGNGRITFTYELERFDRVLEDAFDGYTLKATEAGYTILHGKP